VRIPEYVRNEVYGVELSNSYSHSIARIREVGWNA
jgi:hypothetical protein